MLNKSFTFEDANDLYVLIIYYYISNKVTFSSLS